VAVSDSSVICPCRGSKSRHMVKQAGVHWVSENGTHGPGLSLGISARRFFSLCVHFYFTGTICAAFKKKSPDASFHIFGSARGSHLKREKIMDNFKDKVAIVTGGASGIGRELGKALACRGTHVILSDINGGFLDKAAGDIQKAGFDAGKKVTNVCDYKAVDKLVADTVSEYGRLDYMFNNAGILVTGEARYFSYEDWKKVIDINLYGVVNGVVAAYAVMVKQGSGHIVNIASMAGLIPVAGTTSYTTSKWGVVGLSSALRIEGADLGVKVSVVCPGQVETPILHESKIIKSDRKKLLAANKNQVISTEQCIAEIIAGVEKNKAIIIVPKKSAKGWYIQRLSPGFMRWVLKKGIQKMRAMR
jgi:NAD(P)-dependent dehydrogenase (short-subunit alcohol dehydrogenase family)